MSEGTRGRQLAFDLPAEVAQRREDFFVSPANAVALAAVEGWQDWPQRRMIVIGPEGSGKSHLAAIFAQSTGASLLPSDQLAAADLPALAQGAVVVEDAHKVAGGAEAALFHLWNMMAAGERAFLLTASLPPRDWGLGLPDLASRMMSAPVTRLEPPDDALLAAVLIKLFADRQVAIDPVLIPYLTARMPRSLFAARALVAGLDQMSLQRKLPISRGMAAEFLDKEEPEAE